MAQQYNLEKMQRLFSTVSPEELGESLDNILFTATVSYLDPTQGCSTEQNVNDVTNVRFLLETLRECVRK